MWKCGGSEKPLNKWGMHGACMMSNHVRYIYVPYLRMGTSQCMTAVRAFSVVVFVWREGMRRMVDVRDGIVRVYV